MTNWKNEFYKKYSTFFGKKIDKHTYRKFEPYGKHIIRNFFPLDKNARILDLGCGIGGFLKMYLFHGYLNAEGVDISDEDVALAHQFGMIQVKHGNVFSTLKEAKDSSYDVILFLDVLEHFSRDEILILLNESYRILGSNGRVIIHVPNAEGIFGSKIRYSDITHELAFTSNALGQILTYAGFSSFTCLEDKPTLHNFKGLIRRFLWTIGTFPFRLLHLAETGTYKVRLSQNILFCAIKE
jgi:SAM-dependent methyltransferase